MKLGKSATLKTAIGFKSIYNEEPQDLDFYLKDIPSKYILEATTHLLGYFSYNSDYNNKWQDFLEKYFLIENENEFNKVKNAILKLTLTAPNADIIIVNPLTSLRLFEKVFPKYLSDVDDIVEFDRKESEVNFLKAYLLLNDEYDEQFDASLSKINESKQLKLYEKQFKIILLTSLPDVDFLNHNLTNVFICQVTKGKILFDFLKNNSKCQYLLQETFNYFNVSDEKTIFNHLIHLSIHSIIRQEGGISVKIAKNENFENDIRFFNKLTLSDIYIDSDFKLLREKPLYKIDDTTYRIIYPLFLVEKLYKSWYFKLKDLHENLPIHQKVDKNFRSF